MTSRRMYLLCCIGLLLLGCGPKVMVPPKVDLARFVGIGLISFTSNSQGTLPIYVTQKFIETVTDAQPEAKIIELGSLDKVLEELEIDEFDTEAIRAVGAHYNVDALFTGDLEVSGIKPRLRIANIISTFGVEANVDATLTAKLYETGRSATIWTASVKDRKTVAHVTVFSGGGVLFDADDPDEAYGNMVKDLIKKVTVHLRPSFH